MVRSGGGGVPGARGGLYVTSFYIDRAGPLGCRHTTVCHDHVICPTPSSYFPKMAHTLYLVEKMVYTAAVKDTGTAVYTIGSAGYV